MPYNNKSKNAAGSGSIRKKTINRKGKDYSYWEARFTVGIDLLTGKQKQKTITGKTQKEVRLKLQEALAAVDSGTYSEPSKMTVAEWLTIWQREYLGGVKPGTAYSYGATIRARIVPYLGEVQLKALHPHVVQAFYNSLTDIEKHNPPLSPKTVKNVHGVLHKALQQAVMNGYIVVNPTISCVLPRIEKKELSPLDEKQISAFLKAIQGHELENLFTVTLFTGMREGEVLGLTWDCVDLERGVLTISKQLQALRGTGKYEYRLVPTKNSKIRKITVAPYVVDVLRREKIRQNENRLQAGSAWQENGFVFTDELGHHLKARGLVKRFKAIMNKLGLPDVRFHDLRHSYAVASLRAGDDIKTVQSNLGHATAAFTLDVYGHVTEQMNQASAARMQGFIEAVSS